MFNKKKQSKFSSADSPNPSTIDSDVYVMPEKFQSHKGQSSNRLLMVVVIIFIIVAIASVAYFLYDMAQKDPSSLNSANQNTNTVVINQRPISGNANLNQNQNVNNSNLGLNINTNTNANANVNANVNSNENINANTNTNTNTNVNSNKNINANANTNVNNNANINVNNQLMSPEISSDVDDDGLTDLEENILGTSISRPDTDGDGYTDGQEVIYGFNPLVAGSADDSRISTSTSDFVATITTDFSGDNFQLLYINDWNANPIAATGQVLITTNTGEIIKISVKNNDENISAANSYLRTHPQVSLSQLRNITVGELKGIFSPDGLKAYLTDNNKSKFYIFEYIMDAGSQFRYPTIFTFIIKSFEPIETASLPDLSNNE